MSEENSKGGHDFKDLWQLNKYSKTELPNLVSQIERICESYA